MKSASSLASLAVLGLALLAVLASQRALPLQGNTSPRMSPPPSERLLRAASLAEPEFTAQLLALHVQGYDATPQVAGTLNKLDYQVLAHWLSTIASLDPRSAYSAQLALLYSRVNDPDKKRRMLALVEENFRQAPQLHWRALAEAAIIARHELHDMGLALRYAELLERYATAPEVPGWAQQMHVLLLADLGERERARIVLGALIASGKVHNAYELRLLESRLLHTP